MLFSNYFKLFVNYFFQYRLSTLFEVTKNYTVGNLTLCLLYIILN